MGIREGAGRGTGKSLEWVMLDLAREMFGLRKSIPSSLFECLLLSGQNLVMKKYFVVN
jgi:hypothetical protein